jgi:hypothetical protein
MDVRLIEVDQSVTVALGALSQALELRNEGLPPLKACRRCGSARPSSFLAFFHDSLRRCRATRTVSRQQVRPNCSRTKPTSRRKVQRGVGSAPATGGVTALRWASRTASPRLA